MFDEFCQLFVKFINDVIVDCLDDLIVIMYICCGNFQFIWIVEGGYDVVVEIIFDGLNLDGFFLEYDDLCLGGFELFCYVKCFDFQFVFGLVIFKFGEFEYLDDVKCCIEEVFCYVSLDQFCFSF